MKNIFHRHRYKIIGTSHDPVDNYILVDIICKCGKCGTVWVEKKFENRIMKQAAKGKYLNVPRIIYGEVLIK